MNLGIFGGTFDPIHLGHINASLEFYDKAKLDKLLVIPDRIPPHKQDNTVSAEHRLNMLRLVYDDKGIIGNRNIEISEMELMRTGKSYTIDTLRELSLLYPDAKLFLYVGSDMFYTLESWREGSAILGMCTVFTAAREKDERQKLCEFAEKYLSEYGTQCIIADLEPVVLSSSMIRDILKNGKNSCNFTNNLLTCGVYRYIMENSLYMNGAESQQALIEKVRKELPLYVKESRLSHILSVEKTALLLGDFFISKGINLSRDEIVLSALLHDITKYMDQNKLCNKLGINLSEDDISSEKTVHAITGAFYAKNIYDINDNIFNAILHHTVGSEGMSLLDKIIFVSDYCEETRTHAECIASREMLLHMTDSMKNSEISEILRAFDYITADILGKTLRYLRENASHIHKTTVDSFKYIISQYANDNAFIQLNEEYLKQL